MIKKQRKPLTPEQRAKRNEQARARYWRKTGVSESMIQWMREHNLL